MEAGHLYRLRSGELVAVLPGPDVVGWQPALVVQGTKLCPRGNVELVFPAEVSSEEYPLTDDDRDALAERLGEVLA